MTPKELQHLLDNWKRPEPRVNVHGRSFRRSAGCLKMWLAELPPPARKTIDLEGRLVKDGVRTALRDRLDALGELVHAIRKYRKLFETPLTLQGSDFAQAVEELNKAIDRAVGLMQ